MTDRHAGYLITLTHDIREDDAEAVLIALRMVKGVLAVEPVMADFAISIAQRRERNEISSKLLEFLRSLD